MPACCTTAPSSTPLQQALHSRCSNSRPGYLFYSSLGSPLTSTCTPHRHQMVQLFRERFQLRAVAGASAKWQQRELRGKEFLRCPGRRSGAWSNPRLGQPADPVSE
eukprot:1162087-Pelagomonas_calceolata.AAC.9